MSNQPSVPFDVRSSQREVQQHFSTVLVSTSGTITSQTAERLSHMVVTKTGSETGRYTVTMTGGRRALLLYANAVVIAADDTAVTDATGTIVVLRDNDMATDGTFEIQFCRNTTLADTEIDDGTLGFCLMAVVARETA